MLNYSLGSGVLIPYTGTTWLYSYVLRYHFKQIIKPTETVIIDTGVIFTHRFDEYLEVDIHSSLDSNNIALTKFSVDVNPLKASNISDNNSTLKIHLKNNGTTDYTINIGDFLCEVISVRIFTETRVTLASVIPQPTQSELEYVDLTAAGTAEASKALVLDSNKDIAGINILSSAQIGINETAPDSQLHIKQLADDSTSGMRLEETGDVNYWGMFVSTTGNVLQVHNNSANLGFISSAGTNVQMNFTGQHRSYTSNLSIIENISDYIGMVVSSTGTYKNLNNEELTVNDALPEVDLSNKDNDKKVFGIISDKEDGESRTFQVGIFGSYLEKNEGDDRLFINSVGEGMVWVCSKSGNLENGDLLTSSTAVGYGQLQDDDLMHNYTIGKITQDCDFSTPERYVDLDGNTISKETYDSDPTNGYKCNLVGCVYYCG